MMQTLQPPNPTQAAKQAFKLLHEALRFIESINDNNEKQLNEMIATFDIALQATHEAYELALRWTWA